MTMTPYGYKPPSALPSLIPSAQLSSSPRTPFQYNRALDLSLSSVPHSSRRTSEYCNTPAHGRQGFSKNHLLRPRPLPIQFLVTRALITQALVTQSIILHHHNSVPPKRTPRSAGPRPCAQLHGHPRHPLNMPHPSTRPQQENTPTAASHPPRYGDYHCFGISTIMPFPLIMSRELSDEMRFAFGKSCLSIRR